MKQPLSEEQKEQRRIYQAQWREKNRDKVNQQSLAWVNRQIEKDPKGFHALKASRYKEYREQNLEACKIKSREICKKIRERNPEEYNQRQRDYRKNNPDKFKAYYEAQKQKPGWKETNRKVTLKRYGMTTEDYKTLFSQQEGKCAICLQSDVQLVVDHDHETGKNRALLCDKCNFLIGWVESGLKRNANILSDVAEYLKKMKH